MLGYHFAIPWRTALAWALLAAFPLVQVRASDLLHHKGGTLVAAQVVPVAAAMPVQVIHGPIAPIQMNYVQVAPIQISYVQVATVPVQTLYTTAQPLTASAQAAPSVQTQTTVSSPQLPAVQTPVPQPLTMAPAASVQATAVVVPVAATSLAPQAVIGVPVYVVPKQGHLPLLRGLGRR